MMKKFRTKITAMMCMMFCLVAAGVLLTPNTAFAKKITRDSQAESMARKKVKGGTVVEVDKDYEKGNLVYEVKLIKGTREYDLTYRASNGKLIQYSWEEHKLNRSTKKKIISRSKCRSLAKKQVKGATVLSLRLKYDDGIDQYKVKMKKGNKNYELDYHARTGKLIGYEWEELLKPKNSNNGYIGVVKAKQIALQKVPGATVVKAKFDRDDGKSVYEIELIKDIYEYDIEIDAVTGKILDFEQDTRDDYGYDDDYYDYDD